MAPENEDRSTIAHPKSGDAILLEAVRVTVVAGPDRGLACDLPGERLVVGTHRSAGLVLADDTVSRFHLELIREEGQVVVRDLRSRNGTVVDGVPVREAALRLGATVGLGQSAIRVEAGQSGLLVPVSPKPAFGDLVGGTRGMRAVFSQLERAAATEATVLLLGETGTGKEAAAEAVHHHSPRAAGPFVVVDCGAIPAELLESELFGHERGAFTGAVRARAGAFRAADGGTLFLDEIGEMPRDLQPKLLRALSRKTVKPVGGEAQLPVDVRLVAATNRDLREEVNADRFRGDLYYRLAVVEIRIPPLRDRLDDVPLLVEHLLGEMAGSGADKSKLLSAASLAELRSHRWPGNVRELRNALERSLALGTMAGPSPSEGGEGATPAAGAAPGEVPVDLARPFREAREAWTARFERAYLTALMAEHDGNIRAAARAAGIDRVNLYRLLAKLDLR